MSPEKKKSSLPQQKIGGSSIRDVAQYAGVSITTVSHALSGQRPVAPSTVGKIHQAIAKLGYVPGAAARNLKTGSTSLIALVVPDISNHFFGSMASGAEAVALQRNYGLILCNSNSKKSNENRYFDLLRSKAVDGMIYSGGYTNAENIELFETARDYPVVLVDETIDGLQDIPIVSSNNFEGGRLAAEHLKSLGHKDVAIISGPRGLKSVEDRIDGFKEVIRNFDIWEGGFDEISGAIGVHEIINRNPKISGVFALNDLMAIGALNALSRNPELSKNSVAVVGFDDIESAQRVTPTLSTIRQNSEGMGAGAASILLDMIAKRVPGKSHVVTLDVELIVRESSINEKVRK